MVQTLRAGIPGCSLLMPLAVCATVALCNRRYCGILSGRLCVGSDAVLGVFPYAAPVTHSLGLLGHWPPVEQCLLPLPNLYHSYGTFPVACFEEGGLW